MHRYISSVLLLISLFATTSFLLAKTTIDSAGSERKKMDVIDSFLTRLNQKGFSGAVLVNDGENVFNKCYGLADRESKIKCDEKTIFDIGSVTKQFTGAAILKLEMQGKLSVGNRLDKFFNNLPDDKKAITIHQLLTHSGGFPAAIGDDYEKAERDTFLKSAFKTKLSSKPGVRYKYSNVGYSILTAIIEKVSGKTYEQFLNDNLFKPAGMYSTGYKLPSWKSEQIAVGYRGEKRWGKPTEKAWGKTGPYWNLIGNGGILSTTADLYKWHKALLTDKILNQVAKNKFYKRHIEEGEGAGTYYGYGWALFPTPRKTTLIAHNGSNGIFYCDFLRYTEEKITVILLTNNSRREFEKIPREIVKTLLTKDYTPSIKINPDSKAKNTSLDEHPDGDLLRKLLSTISGGDKEAIKALVKEHFAPDLLAVASMEKHVQILSGFGMETKDFEIEIISVDGPETVISFKGKADKLKIMIEDGKIAGMRL